MSRTSRRSSHPQSRRRNAVRSRAADGVILIKNQSRTFRSSAGGGYAQSVSSLSRPLAGELRRRRCGQPRSPHAHAAVRSRPKRPVLCPGFRAVVQPAGPAQSFATSMRHHAGFHATGGPAWGAFRMAGGIDAMAVCTTPRHPESDSYNRWNVTSSGTLRPRSACRSGIMSPVFPAMSRCLNYGPVGRAPRSE